MSWAIAGTALVAVTILTLVVLRRGFVQVRIEGSSMEPGLSAGDHVLVRRTRTTRRGQVVVLAFPPRSATDPGHPPWLIKRVAAVPGDPVPRDMVPALRNVADRTVPPGRLVLLGDNPSASYDSRRAGYFNSDDLLGVVIRTMASR
jgi:signal peptidase I